MALTEPGPAAESLLGQSGVRDNPTGDTTGHLWCCGEHCTVHFGAMCSAPAVLLGGSGAEGASCLASCKLASLQALKTDMCSGVNRVCSFAWNGFVFCADRWSRVEP